MCSILKFINEIKRRKKLIIKPAPPHKKSPQVIVKKLVTFLSKKKEKLTAKPNITKRTFSLTPDNFFHVTAKGLKFTSAKNIVCETSAKKLSISLKKYGSRFFYYKLIKKS